MPQVDAEWKTALVAVAGEMTTARGRTFTTQTQIDMENFDELILRVSALSLPTAAAIKVWPMSGDKAASPAYGYVTDLGGVDFGIPAPKADFVSGSGKVLPMIRAKSPRVKIDVTVDVTDALATCTIQYLRSKSMWA